MSDTEKVLGCLNDVNGYTYDIVYDLFFTTDRLIVMVIQHPSDVLPPSFSGSLTSLIIGSYLERRNQQAEQLSIAAERRRFSKNASPQELLEYDSLNFAIHYDEISSARIILRMFDCQLKFSFSGSSNKKMASFRLHKNQLAEARRLLGLVLTPAQFPP